MDASRPDDITATNDEPVPGSGGGSPHEDAAGLSRLHDERERLRALLLDGAGSAPGPVADQTYFEALRAPIRSAT